MRRLIAVEEVPTDGSRRRIRAANVYDETEKAAEEWIARHDDLLIPGGVPITPAPGDARPVSYGVFTIADLHTKRQLAYLAAAHRWINRASVDESTRRALRIAVSSTLTSNNRLCGYATDYGRLAPLFSVRAYALPWLTVELNPLNNGGRGSLPSALKRVAKSASDTVRRATLSPTGEVRIAEMMLPRHGEHRVALADATAEQSADDPLVRGRLAHICLTDPPYYDFIAYDTLSQVLRVWLPETDLAGPPLLPAGEDRVSDFGTRLGSAFRAAMERACSGAPLVFTYKGGQDAWTAVGGALDEAKLRVTALWPVLADPHMGHHTHDGNCEYDVLVIARPYDATNPCAMPQTLAGWIEGLTDLYVSNADLDNMREALTVGERRWGVVIAD